MVGCVLSQLKPSELYILSFEKGLGLRPRPLYSGFILYIIQPTYGNLQWLMSILSVHDIA